MTWHTEIITECGNFTQGFKQLGFCSSLLFPQPLGPWFPNEEQTFFYLKRKVVDPSVQGTSVHSLLSSRKFLNRLCLTVLLRLWSSLLMHLYLPHFSLPVIVLWLCSNTILQSANSFICDFLLLYPLCRGSQ